MSPPENLPPKAKIVFSILTRRLAESVDGLNISLALAAGDLWPKNCEPGQHAWIHYCVFFVM